MYSTGRYRIKHLIKLCLAYALYYSGVLHIMKAWKLNGRAVVLMYHRVLPQEEMEHSCSHPGIIVERSAFERQMAFLKREFNVLSLPELCRHLEHRIPFGKNVCLITFDDGWKDSIIHAYPVLKKHSLPAVVFLPVGYIGTDRMFWQEELTGLLLHVHRRAREDGSAKKRLHGLLTQHMLEGVLDLQEGEVREGISKIVQAKKAEPREDVHELIQGLKAGLDAKAKTGPVDGFMDWRDVKTMIEDGISFGTHGADHLILTKLDPAELIREMADSKRILEEKTGTTVAAISYPNGDCNTPVIEAARTEGYRVAFTTHSGYAHHSGDPLAINRINVHTDTARNAPLFLSRILEIF